MRKAAVLIIGIAVCVLCFASGARAQSETGGLELTARITPTAARPEPVRQFTFYILTKSYSEIVKEIEENDPVPPRDQFIDGLKISPELRTWLKGHDMLDLTEPELDKQLTPDDILNIPEFLVAYQRTNSGGVTAGLPKPKYTDACKTIAGSACNASPRTWRSSSFSPPRRIQISKAGPRYRVLLQGTIGSVRSIWTPMPEICACDGMFP